jgi:hypothetical protein
LIGDKSHLIDRLAGRSAGDHNPHTLLIVLKPNSEFKTADCAAFADA